MSLLDLQKKVAEEEAKYFKNYLEYASRIKQIARELLGDESLKVVVFGSAVRGEAVPGKSDIDILIISPKAPISPGKQAELRTKILERLGDPLAPFEIHIATPEIYERWYRKHIGVALFF